MSYTWDTSNKLNDSIYLYISFYYLFNDYRSNGYLSAS